MADLKLDLYDSLQPVALLKANQTLRAMRAVDRLEIRGADPSMFQALMRLFPEARFTLTEAQLQPAGYCIRLLCRPPDHPHSNPAGTARPSERRTR